MPAPVSDFPGTHTIDCDRLAGPLGRDAATLVEPMSTADLHPSGGVAAGAQHPAPGRWWSACASRSTEGGGWTPGGAGGGGWGNVDAKRVRKSGARGFDYKI